MSLEHNYYSFLENHAADIYLLDDDGRGEIIKNGTFYNLEKRIVQEGVNPDFNNPALAVAYPYGPNTLRGLKDLSKKGYPKVWVLAGIARDSEEGKIMDVYGLFNLPPKFPTMSETESLLALWRQTTNIHRPYPKKIDSLRLHI
ncbi:MAG: hypothetical protein Q8Q35_01785 [Nanoarchaeota archaeon]|nr:hypothetical protein [Nanoarchaeota archaeon]